MEHFHKASFAIDSIPENVFVGYTEGKEWNGWACPYYEQEEAERILKLCEFNGDWWKYDEENDAFIVGTHTGGNDTAPEIFRSLTVAVDDKLIKVYPIGTQAWIWEEVFA